MNILTFDIEEWYHILDNPSTRTEKEWGNFEVRIHKNMERILQLLEDNKVSASFFVMGWIAEKFPEVVREISDRGYEIGSHTHMHQLVYDQTPAGFKKDVEKSIKTLEDISGKKVNLFRAPGFSITERNKWALEILAELGIETDCSIFPAPRGHGGFPSYGVAAPSMITYKGIQLKEFPINYRSVFSKPIIFSGGGYFRLFPYPVIRKFTQDSPYVMTYFHPRDFDPAQPVIKGLSNVREFKCYVGLKGAEKKLNKWIQETEFIDIQTADRQIDWSKAPRVAL